VSRNEEFQGAPGWVTGSEMFRLLSKDPRGLIKIVDAKASDGELEKALRPGKLPPATAGQAEAEAEAAKAKAEAAKKGA
jgi:hypothetical protein